MKAYTLFSGSSGNSSLIVGEKLILLDAGVSMKRINLALETLGYNLEDIDSIFITHEHSDHIASLGSIMRKYKKPVYATGGTIRALCNISRLKLKDSEISLFNVLNYEDKIKIGDITVENMKISHDAIEPSAYKFSDSLHNIAIVTDLGNYNNALIQRLTNLDAVLLEANHDKNMLEVGDYPYELKRRILSDMGHLSNERSRELLEEILSNRLKNVLLGHLSKENNIPELAYQVVSGAIKNIDCSLSLSLAQREGVTCLI